MIASVAILCAFLLLLVLQSPLQEDGKVELQESQAIDAPSELNLKLSLKLEAVPQAQQT